MNTEIQKKKDAKNKLKNHIKNLAVIKKPYASEERILKKTNNIKP